MVLGKRQKHVVIDMFLDDSARIQFHNPLTLGNIQKHGKEKSIQENKD
jgi:hypothetical protein